MLLLEMTHVRIKKVGYEDQTFFHIEYFSKYFIEAYNLTWLTYFRQIGIERFSSNFSSYEKALDHLIKNYEEIVKCC